MFKMSPFFTALSLTLSAALLATTLHPNVHAQTGGKNVMLVLDASGSMEETLGNYRKIDVLKSRMGQFIRGLSDDVTMGLRVYSMGDGSCTDSQLMTPPGRIQKQSLMDVVNQMSPRGMTPLALSMQQALNDFPRNGRKNVMVVVTDGLETCKGDPCAVAAEAARQGVEIQVISVGLDGEADKTLRCISDNTQGEFFDVDKPDQFPSALQKVAEVAEIGDYAACIDWDARAAVAVGSGVPPATASQAQKRPMATRAAQVDAYRQLAECIHGVKLDAQTTVRDFVTENDQIQTQVSGLIKGAQVVGAPRMLDYGAVEVTVQIPLTAIEHIVGRPIRPIR